MATNVKQAILKAKVEGAIVELMVKSNIENIYFDDTTTLASKLATMISDIDARMKTTDVNSAIDAAKNAIRQELLGDAPVEAYNTFTELATYISEHKEAADLLTEAVGKKADQTTVEAIQASIEALGSLAKLNEVAEENLSAALREKVNAASEGNHAHLNKALLDTYTQTEENLADAVAKKHEHSNKALLDTYTQTEANLADAVAKKHAHENADVLAGITAAKVTSWEGKADQTTVDEIQETVDGLCGLAFKDEVAEENLSAQLQSKVAAGVNAWNNRSTVYYAAAEPANLRENDLWVQIIG